MGTISDEHIEGYCRERWGFGRDYANKVIRGMKFTRLDTTVSKPQTEAFVSVMSLTLHRLDGECLGPDAMRATGWREAPDGWTRYGAAALRR